MIISELSHSAEQLPVLEDETVVDIKSGDFISAVLTQSGTVMTLALYLTCHIPNMLQIVYHESI